MAKKSKFFRVAVEGATTDGRKIERNWLTESAAGYNRATYGARVNMEHIRGFSADPPFCAYGDVLALKTEEIELELNGKTEKRLALFAEIEPNDELLKINAKKQKLYTSCEFHPDFAGTGKFGLVGLAVTDNPASLGTEMLAFAAGAGDANPLAARKSDPKTMFSAAEEVTFEFVDAPEPTPSPEASFFNKAAELLSKLTGGTPAPAPTPSPSPSPSPSPTPPEPSNDNDKFAALAGAVSQMSQGITAFTTKVEGQLQALTTDLNTVKASIDNTDGGSAPRKPATGSKNFAQTDF